MDLDGHLNGPVPKDGAASLHSNIVYETRGVSTNKVAAGLHHSQRQISDTCIPLTSINYRQHRLTTQSALQQQSAVQT